MATPKENNITSSYVPVLSQDNDGYAAPASASASASSGGNGCFRRFCCGWDDGEGYAHLLRSDSWVVEKLKNLREFSEVAAGPRWKNLIRKMGKVLKPSRQKPAAAAATGQFQYSPESYALNFAGDGGDLEEEGGLMQNFSVRFAAQGKKAGL